MRRRTVAVAPILVSALLLAGCSGRQRAEPMRMNRVEATSAATVLAEGESWVPELVDDQNCTRLRSGNDATLCVAELAAGQLPWGVQVFDADGALRSATSMVGWG